MGAFMAVLGLGGGLLGAYGKYQQGRQAQATANYNARLREQQAKLTEQAMASETTRSHQEARRMKASQEAAYASSGAVVGSGTPLLVLAEQAGAMEKDILNQRRSRMMEAQGLRSEAAMLKYEGRMAKRAGTIGAVSTLLGTGASLAGGMGGGGGSGAATGASSYSMPQGMGFNLNPSANYLQRNY
jgi:hypothetical protein